MSDSILMVYGVDWCPDCRRCKKFLDDNGITYQWFDIDEDQSAEAFVKEKNFGNRSVPTIVFPDGSLMVEPTNAQLKQKFGKA